MNSVPGFVDKKGLVATTLTGIDEHTDFSRALDLSHEFSFLEWGVLLGGAPSPRYPHIDTIANWASVCHDRQARTALHLCGKFARQWIAGDPDIVELARQFGRIQVNVVAARTDVDALVDAVTSSRHPRVITQHNAANETITHRLINEHQHAVLFDASGGRGEATTSWPTHIPGKACGYAGGLSPETVEEELEKIAAQAGPAFWIDMEGRVRTAQDTLDLDRCQRVLANVQRWLVARN